MNRHENWGRTIATVLSTPYPWISGHMSLRADDVDVTPERLHPAFHGSYDWHSSAHMQWSGVRLIAEGTLSADTAAAITDQLDQRLTREHGEQEAAYLRERPSFERPYGWAWAAMLAAAVADSSHGSRWAEGSALVADQIADNLLAWLPRQAYPVRHGVHANTAFALALCHEAYSDLGRTDVVAAVAHRAVEWFGTDRDAPVAWEPSGEDFLSASLSEADLMRRVLEPEAFERWLARFLPHLGAEGDPLLGVPEVHDRSDGKFVHLYGLALSRAWQLRLLAPYVESGAAQRIATATERQVSTVEHEIDTGDFVSTHWLVSFALLASQV